MKANHKTLILSLAIIWMMAISVDAQTLRRIERKVVFSDSISNENSVNNNDPLTKDFHLVYIDHEPSPATPATQLCTRIMKMRTNAVESGNPLVVYLANDDTPMISFTNLADPDPQLHRDSVEAFYDIVDALQNIGSHEVNSNTDVETLKGLIGIDGHFPMFDETNIEDVKLRYKSVTIDFYIGPRFWNLRYNDNIIAQLYTILRLSKYMKKFPRKSLSFNVYKAQGQTLKYPEGQPFGIHNKDGINDNPKVNVIKEY